MPAYKVPLETKCAWRSNGRCKKRASYEVYNRWNESQGTFCLAHANARMKQLNTTQAITTEVVQILEAQP